MEPRDELVGGLVVLAVEMQLYGDGDGPVG